MFKNFLLSSERKHFLTFSIQLFSISTPRKIQKFSRTFWFFYVLNLISWQNFKRIHLCENHQNFNRKYMRKSSTEARVFIPVRNVTIRSLQFNSSQIFTTICSTRQINGAVQREKIEKSSGYKNHVDNNFTYSFVQCKKD